VPFALDRTAPTAVETLVERAGEPGPAER
jgi:hypothetical protein